MDDILRSCKADQYYANDGNAILNCFPDFHAKWRLFLIVYAALSALAFGFFALFHAFFILGKQKQSFTILKIEKKYNWTNKIPILNSILEIPIGLKYCPYTTFFAWGNFFGICIITVFTGLWSHDQPYSDEELGGVLKHLGVSVPLAIFCYYQLTGELCEYRVQTVPSNLAVDEDDNEEDEESYRQMN